MKITTREVGEKILVVRGEGRMTVGRGDAILRDAVSGFLEEGRKLIVLDMKDVPWMDSGSIGEVVATFKRIRDNEGQLRLVLNQKVHDTFTLYELQRVLDIHDTVDAAIASFV